MNFERPTFLINPDICKQNIRKMAGKADRSGVVFRPHFKTHQSRVIGRWFREEGITRITVSSLTAARYFAADGWNDITVAFPVNLREVGLINDLASRIRLGLLFEHPETARALLRDLRFPVDAWIKIDTGYHRTGLGPGEMPLIRELAGVIAGSGLLTLKGLLTHAGHTYSAGSPEGVRAVYKSSTAILNGVADHLADFDSGLLRSYGDTPSCSLMEEYPGVDEIRPGNFIFYDLMQLEANTCEAADIAGIVVCPVVAVHPERNQVVVYGGAIHFSKDFIEKGGKRLFGQMVELHKSAWKDPVPEAYVVSLSQEHGVLEMPREAMKKLVPGGTVGVIPVHSCLTANLLQGYQTTDGQTADYMIGN